MIYKIPHIETNTVKNLLSTILILASTTYTFASEEYLKFFTTGKICNYERVNGHNPDAPHDFFSISVIGDTLIGEYEGKILHNIHPDNTENTLYPFIAEQYWIGVEIEGSTYSYNDELDYLAPLCDFNFSTGDTIRFCQYTKDGPIHLNYGMIVTRSNIINIRGINRKVLTLEYPLGTYVDNWIEGIGSIHHRFPTFGSWIHGDITTMTNCYIEDVCVYEDGDLNEYNNVLGTQAEQINLIINSNELKCNFNSSKGYMSLYGTNGITYGRAEGSGELIINITELPKGLYIVETCNAFSCIIKQKLFIYH